MEPITINLLEFHLLVNGGGDYQRIVAAARPIKNSISTLTIREISPPDISQFRGCEYEKSKGYSVEASSRKNSNDVSNFTQNFPYRAKFVRSFRRCMVHSGPGTKVFLARKYQ